MTQRNLNFINLLILFVIILFSGCTMIQQPVSSEVPLEPAGIPFEIETIKTQDEIGQTLIKPEKSIRQDNQYYFFIEAQLQKRKGNLNKAVYFIQKAIEYDPDSVFLQKELADFYLRQDDGKNALIVIEGIVRKNPDNVEAIIVLGRLKEELKQFKEAKEAYEKVLAKDPKQKDIYLLLGNLYMEDEDFSNARRIYEQLIQYQPDSYVGHYYLGKIYAKQKNFIEAEKELKKTLELESGLEEPRFELIGLYEAQGEKEKAIQLYEELLTANPDNFRVAMEYAYFNYKNGMTHDAETMLKQLGLRSLIEPEVLRTLVQVYITPQKYDAAIVILNGLLKGAPESSDIYYVLGIAYDGIKDKANSIEYLKKVAPNSKFYTNAAVHVAFLLQEQGQINDAINFLNEVIRKVPNNPEFMLYLGSCYEEIEDFEKAEKTLKRGIAIDPENARLYFRLGVVFDKWGKKEDSIQAMKTVIRLDPKDSNALNYLGYTYADMGQNLDEAEQLIQEALKYKPDDGYILDSLGWVYFKKGFYDKSVEILDKAANLSKEDPIILEHLGDAYLKLNNKEKALDYYQRSLLKKEKPKEKEILEKKIQELKGTGL